MRNEEIRILLNDLKIHNAYGDDLFMRGACIAHDLEELLKYIEDMDSNKCHLEDNIEFLKSAATGSY